MPDPLDPDDLDPATHATEVCELVAAGYLRHRALRETAALEAAGTGAADAALEPRRQRENDLEAPGDQSVHVRTARS